MRICHIITSFLRAGSEENTALTCNFLATKGYEVSLIHGHDFHPEMRTRLNQAITCYCLANLRREVRPLQDLTALFQLYLLLRKIGPDVVHTHASKAGILGRLAAALAGVPRVVHTVHILPFVNVPPIQRWFYLRLERLAARSTAAFINVSEAMRLVCLSEGIGDPGRHYVALSGMDVARFQRATRPTNWRDLIDARRICVPAPKFLLLAGALEPRKRQYEFLSVFREIAIADPQVILLLAGEGDQRATIETAIERMGLGGRVVCLGYRSDLEQLIALAHVCLQTSVREGLPRTVIQYALVGRPVVATSTPGVDEIVRNGETGYLVPVDDLTRMREPILALLNDSERREMMAEAARQLDLSDWEGARMVSQIETVYETVVERMVGAKPHRSTEDG